MSNNLIIVSSKPLLRIKNLMNLVEEEEGYNVFEASDSDSAIDEAQKLESSVVLFFINQIENINDIIELSGALYDEIENNEIKVVVVSYAKHGNLKSILNKIGVDYVFSGRADLEIVRKSIGVCFNKMEKQQKSLKKHEEQLANLKIPQSVTKVEVVGTMETPFDYFVSEGKKSYKRVIGEWEIELTGPSLNVGTWIRSRREEYRAQRVWEYITHTKTHELFKGQEGTWFYSGKRPKYKDDKWIFKGERPVLYYKDGLEEEFKIQNKDGGATLLIRDNNIKEKEILKLIYESYRSRPVGDTISYELPNLEKKEVELPIPSVSARAIFQPVETKQERIDFIEECVRDKRDATVWTAKQKIVTKGIIKHKEGEDYLIEWNYDQENTKLIKEIANKKHKMVYSKMDLPHGLVFFPIKAPQINYGENFLNIKLPDEMWKVQRRRYFRLEFKERNRISCLFKFGGISIHCKIMNISAGGCAFEFESDFELELDDVLEEVTFKILTDTLVTAGEVKWTGKKNRKLQAGVKFLNLNEADENFINRYVLENSFHSQR
jgi:DNA-binding NarL/FixJ family response regulator